MALPSNTNNTNKIVGGNGRGNGKSDATKTGAKGNSALTPGKIGDAREIADVVRSRGTSGTRFNSQGRSDIGTVAKQGNSGKPSGQSNGTPVRGGNARKSGK